MPDLTETRSLSRTLFGGAQYRIEVGAAIVDAGGMVCIVDLVDALGRPPGQASVNAELKVLERRGCWFERRSNRANGAST